jgi:hypothetical protein
VLAGTTTPAALAGTTPAVLPAATPAAVAGQPAAARLVAVPRLLDPAPAAAPARVIMIIRHGEKPGDTPGRGIAASGRPDKHSLTPRGWSRARSLTTLFTADPAADTAHLPAPGAIYAAGATGGGTGQRTRETVGPLSSRLNVPVNTVYGKGQESALVRTAIAQAERGKPVLICWQHGEIPAIASKLKVVGQQPPRYWPDSRYDVVWKFTETPDGWTFSQVPQLVLAGDSASAWR